MRDIIPTILMINWRKVSFLLFVIVMLLSVSD